MNEADHSEQILGIIISQKYSLKVCLKHLNKGKEICSVTGANPNT